MWLAGVSQGDGRVDVESGEMASLAAAFASKDDAIYWAKGTSGDEGVVRCASSGGGVTAAVEGSVVNVEKTGGETSCVSWAYGPIVNMVFGGPGEEMLADAATGECTDEFTNDAGEDGGTRARTACAGSHPRDESLAPCGRAAGTIRFSLLCDLKHQYLVQYPLHLLGSGAV